MFTFCVILLSGLVMVAARWLFSGRRACGAPLLLFEYLADTLLLLGVTLTLFTTSHHVSISPWTGHPLSFVYGRAPALFSVALGLALGALQGRLGLVWSSERHAQPLQRARKLGHGLFLLLLLVTAVLLFAYLWGVRKYPILTLEEIVFHLTMPLQGTVSTFVSDVLRNVALPVALVCAAYGLAAWLPARRGALRLTLTRGVYVQVRPLRVCPALAVPVWLGLLSLLLLCLDRYVDLKPFFYNNIHTSSLIEEEYVDPNDVTITFPEKKRNLISLYIESGETTFQDRENGGLSPVNYTPELTRVARENLSFSQSEGLLRGAAVAPSCGWTIAGLVAQTAGLPLKLISADSAAERFVNFLPGVTSLGDILEAQGYRRVFMAGSDFTFGGRRLYYTQHGDYEIFDVYTAKEKGLIPQDYIMAWGFEDAKLYEYAKAMLTELAAGEQPFHFSLLTIDTHMPGFPCPDCPKDIDDPYLRVVACASRKAADFVDWVQAQPFFENTALVVTGDHASMAYPDSIQGVDVEEYDMHAGSTDRLVYNAFINAAFEPVRAEGRLFTTLDFFPSSLSAIGATIEGERLGLGTNLFSGAPTLAEEYGYETLFAELALRSPFYNRELFYPKEK